MKAKESNDPYLGGEEKTTHRHGISPKPLIKRKSGGLGKAIDALNVATKGSIGKNTVDASSIPRSGPISLPFEFRALEACLESACRCLEIEVFLTFYTYNFKIFASNFCCFLFYGVQYFGLIFFRLKPWSRRHILLLTN